MIICSSPAQKRNTLLSTSYEKVFYCPEETEFYSSFLQRVFQCPYFGDEYCVEFGSGDGRAVLDALLKIERPAFIQGFELNFQAASTAMSRVRDLSLDHKYNVSTGCFFEGTRALLRSPFQEASPVPTWLLANPPYLPAPDANILMPELHGGNTGGELTMKLMELGVQNAVLMVASISNPLEVVRCAQALGYRVADFSLTFLPFGVYSSEPKVMQHIRHLQKKGQAFFAEAPVSGICSDDAVPPCTCSSGKGAPASGYFLAGVLFQKATQASEDKSNALIRALTSL